MDATILVTDAGIQEIINAEKNGTAPVVLSEVGLGTAQYTPTHDQTALKGELKRLPASALQGGLVGDKTIYITARDTSSDAYTLYEFGIYTESGTLFAVCSQTIPILQKASASQSYLDIEFVLTNVSPASVTLGDTNFFNPPASTTMQGVVELATDEETIAGTDGSRAVTPRGLHALSASENRKGLVMVGKNISVDKNGKISLPEVTAEMLADGAVGEKVLNLPDADFGSFSSPDDNRVYILQGEGPDRDRKAPLGDLFDWLVGAKAMTNDSPQHRVGDIVFKIEEAPGGKILTAYVMDGRTLEKPTVTGGLKADSIEGTNQGQGDTKYLALGNTTVNGDLDVKNNATLADGLLNLDRGYQKIEASAPIDFINDVYFNPSGSVFVKKSSNFNIENDFTIAPVGRMAIVMNSNTDGTTSIKVTFGYSPYLRTITIPAWCCMAFVKTPAVGDQVSFWRPLFGTM